MVAPQIVYPMEVKSKPDPAPERTSPTEGVISAFEKRNDSFSATSLSSPGSTSRIDCTLGESRAISGIPSHVMSFPSSASFDANAFVPRVHSAPFLAMPDAAIAGNLASPGGSLSSVVDIGSKTSRKHSPKHSVTRRRSTGSKPRNKPTVGEHCSEATAHRRQKRLQRNRESARLSRRRRKQYLEILEERVNKLSDELDKGRRAHVAAAINSIHRKRENCLQNVDYRFPASMFLYLSKILRWTSEEMMICTSFRFEQLKSFFVPPSLKFVMWLTLQSDQFYRGGRAASERLSAARIGERMLTGGNDRATATQQMWPLLCNEICLSYEQEEKVRGFQKSVLQDHECWVDRHRVFSSEKALASAFDSVQALTLRIGQRENTCATILSAAQYVKFASWIEKNRKRATLHSAMKISPTIATDTFHTTREQHVAANLYILNHRFENVLHRIPRAAPLVFGAALRKLAVRPSFESIGSQDEKSPDSFITKEDSFPSSGSLNKSEADMNMDNEEKIQSQITPLQAQETARPRVEEALSHVLSIIPAVRTSFSVSPMGSSTLQGAQTSVSFGTYPASHCIPPTVTSMDQTPPISYQTEKQSHERKSSFLPAHLNVVPEEMWPDEADEFLMDLVEGDWAIGEGIDMDTFDTQ